MRNFSTMIASVTLLLAFALPAVSGTPTYPPRVSETAFAGADKAYGAFDRQAPTSATELNDHVYYGGPKVND